MNTHRLWEKGILALVVLVAIEVRAADVFVTDETPDIFFDDTNVINVVKPFQWAIGTDLIPNTFTIAPVDNASGGSIPAFQIDHSAAQASMFLGSAGVGVGTTAPAPGSVHIVSASPNVVLDNGEAYWQLASDSTAFVIGKIAESRFPFIIGEDAPNASLVIDNVSGNVGIGAAPSSSLNVVRNDGTAKVAVEENLAASNPGLPQTMFELRRSGAVRFDLVDESQGKTWIFQNRNGAFDITLQGTGVQEFKVDPSGNLTIQGELIQLSDVNAKEDFQNVEGESVLESLRHLPITKWRFKGDVTGDHHIGPMAQDFRAVFQLSDSGTTIAPLDVASVAVAGVKELDARTQATDARITDLVARLKRKDQELEKLRLQMKELAHRIDQDRTEGTLSADHKAPDRSDAALIHKSAI